MPPSECGLDTLLDGPGVGGEAGDEHPAIRITAAVRTRARAASLDTSRWSHAGDRAARRFPPVLLDSTDPFPTGSLLG
jgi:hypothetical protein